MRGMAIRTQQHRVYSNMGLCYPSHNVACCDAQLWKRRMASTNPMTDYYPLLAKAVAGLEKNEPDQRRALYERARTALVAQLRGLDPPLTESEITRERLALEESIRKVESERARKARLKMARIDPLIPTQPPLIPTHPAPPIDEALKGFRDVVAEDENTGKKYSQWAVSDPLAELAQLFERLIGEEERQRAEAQRQREEQERQQAAAQRQQEEQARRERAEALRRSGEEAER
jgi:hypothetical protein